MVAFEVCNGRPVELTLEELAHRYFQAARRGHNFVDYAKLQMTPDTAVALFESIGSMCSSGPPPAGSIYINLAENRMGTISVEELSTIFKVMEECEWLCVNFGYDIVWSNLSTAMTQHNGLDCRRVTVDCPWEHPSNMIIASTLATVAETQKLLADSSATAMNKLDSIASTLATIAETQKLLADSSATAIYKLDSIASTLATIAETQKVLAVSSTGAMNKVNSVCTSYNGHIKSTADALEYEVSKGIAKFLEDGNVIVSNYKYAQVIEETVGDIDCLVEGKLPGVGEVVVIAEVKTNMPKKCGGAVLQLEGNIKRWEALCDFVPPEDPDDLMDQDQKAMAIDYKMLQVERLRDRKVVRAVGGALFPPELDKFFHKKMRNNKWLRVELDGAMATVVAKE